VGESTPDFSGENRLIDLPALRLLFLLATLGFVTSQALAQSANPAPAPGAGKPQVQVFVLHSYSQEYPWTRGQHQGFMAALDADKGHSYDVRVEYLDTKRAGYGSDYARLIAGHLGAKYAGYRPAAIYVSDDNALSFALVHLERIFPGVPVFFSGVNDYTIKTRLDPRRVTGVFENKEIGPNLALIRTIAEERQDIIVIGDASETYRAIENEVRAELHRHPGVQAVFVSSNRLDDLIARLNKARARFVFLTTLGAVVDATGRTLGLPETLDAIVRSGDFIILSMEDAYLQKGVLGGWVTSGPRQGKAAAELLRRHLEGASLDSLPPIEESPNEYVFDDLELERVGLTLPPEVDRRALHLNVQPGFYEANRRIVLGVLYGMFAVVLLGLLWTVLVYAHKNRLILATSRRLAESEARFLATFEQAAVGIAQVAPDGSLLRVNRRFCDIVGYRREELLQRTFLDITHPDDGDLHRDRVLALLAREIEFFAVEKRYLRKDGEVVWINLTLAVTWNVDGTPDYFISVIEDISERKRAAEALRRSEEEQRTLIASLPDVIMRFDAEERHLFVSENVRELVGMPATAFIGKTHRELGFPEHLCERWQGALKEVFESGNAHETEFALDGPKGSRTFSWRLVPDMDRSGRVRTVLTLARDITERKESESRLEDYRQHLEQMVEERTAALSIAKEAAEAASRAKSTFLANMSHELRTPMNVIMGMTNLALRRVDDPRLKDLLSKVDQASRNLLGVINDILDISKIEAERLSLEQVDFTLDDVLNNLSALIGHKVAEKGLGLHIDVTPEGARRQFKGDPLRLGQILINLAANAVKFTDAGSISVRVRVEELGGEELRLLVEVQDTGIGIAAEDLKRLFTAFEQADGSMTRKYGGTGLGLAISRRLARMMGGDIEVSSRPGAGSTFRLQVRLRKATSAVAPAPTSVRSVAEERLKAGFTGTRILLAEDEPTTRDMARWLLEDCGLVVDLAEDGAQAVALAECNHYGLILMDMQMPRLNGVEATRAIRALPGHVRMPILAMTANAFAEDRQVCLDAGMDDHIGKPVDPDLLFEVLLHWLTLARGEPPVDSQDSRPG
jgi:PAS domain S-box-containing protein